MRTIVDIPKDKIMLLDKIAAEMRISRAEVIRRSIADYLSGAEEVKSAFDIAFASWAKGESDSVDYQRLLRDEWNS